MMSRSGIYATAIPSVATRRSFIRQRPSAPRTNLSCERPSELIPALWSLPDSMNQ